METVLLALTFFLNLVSGLTPRTSTNIPLVSKYLMFSMVLVTLSVMCSVTIANLHHRTPEIHAMPEWLRSIFLDTLPTVLLMKKPLVPKPIFPVGHRFSITNDYPHQYNTYVEPKEESKPKRTPLVLSDEQIKVVSGRPQTPPKPKKIKFRLTREGLQLISDFDNIMFYSDTIFQVTPSLNSERPETSSDSTSNSPSPSTSSSNNKCMQPEGINIKHRF